MINLDKIAGSILRTVMAGAGGWLLHHGFSQEVVDGAINGVVPIVGGLLSWGVAQGWSLVEKTKKRF